METKELISVIVPVYNVEKYLYECIDSVLTQTYPKFEIILVDDGSTDSSRNICEEYVKNDSRVRLICQENAGASAARNTGLRVATGEYIYFLDSDDWLDKNAFESLINLLEKEETDVVFFDAYSVDEGSGNVSDKHYSHRYEYETDKGYLLLKRLVKNNEFHVTPWSMFFRHEFLQKKEISFVEGIIYEDLIFAYKVFCMAERIAYLSKYLYYRRYRENSVMTSKVKKRNFDSAVRVYAEVLRFAESVDISRNCPDYIVRCAYNVFNVYERLNKKDKKICAKELARVKKKILSDNAHGDKALRLRCYHKALWGIYKVISKIRNSIC